MNNKKKALIIDGNSMIYRFFYASMNQLEYYKQNNLFPTNALRLMIDTCFKLKESNDFKYGIIAFDCSKKTFRTEEYDAYKAGRAKMPEELVMQLKPTQDALALMGFNVLFLEGIEADDIIGSSAKVLSKDNVECHLYSSDRDLLQLVSNNISVFLMKQGIKILDEHNVDNFLDKNNGLTPNQVIDYKGIVGDTSDNLPGVKGIGEKTGIQLLTKYHTLEEIYDHLDELSKAQQAKFNESKDMAFLCKRMATIKTDLYNKDEIQQFEFKDYQHDALKEVLEGYGLKTLYKYL